MADWVTASSPGSDLLILKQSKLNPLRCHVTPERESNLDPDPLIPKMFNLTTTVRLLK